jgi:hypothetical protein
MIGGLVQSEPMGALGSRSNDCPSAYNLEIDSEPETGLVFGLKRHTGVRTRIGDKEESRAGRRIEG